MVNTRMPVRYQNRSSSQVTVIGTTEQFVFTSATVVSTGRFMSPEEVEGGRPVCVIGADVATNLFMRQSPLGQRLTVGQQSFEVVGVLERQGRFMGQFSLDN